ncbi:hypothetical protein BH10BAC1_BH10BAC1_00050 [soil metagenome]
MLQGQAKSINKIIVVIGALLFSYTAYRAFVLSFTWDEAFSYLQFVRHQTLFPDKYETMDANNHLLNTWLNIQFVKLFGISEFVLRIPSLIAHLLFLVFSFKLLKNFENAWLVLASFLIVNLNPYILDFFSLSRGYALSLGLMMASVYYIYSFVRSEYRTKDMLLALVFGALATAANFVLLNYFLVSFGLLFLLAVHNFIDEKNKRKFISALLVSSVFFSLCLLFFVPIALKLKDAGALFYGGNNGFWTDTICTIVDRSFYELGYNNWFLRAAKGFVILIGIASVLFVGIKRIKKQTDKNTLFLTTLVLLLVLCSLSTIVQHAVFGTLYLMDRTTMFLVVLFNLVLVFFVNEVSKTKRQVSVISYLMGFFMVLHFGLSFNLHYVLEWKSNADAKQMLSDLEKIKVIPKEKSNVSICIPLSFDQSINYYRAVNNLNWVNTVERSRSINYMYDYLYLEPEQLVGKNLDSLEIIKTYPYTNNILAKPKYPIKLTKVCVDQQLNFENNPYLIDEKVEYAQGFSYKINDSITPGRTAELAFTAKVSAADIAKCNQYIIISLENKEGVYLWKRAYIKDWIQNSNEWVDVCYSIMVPQESMAGDELKSYIWNPNKHSLLVKKMEFKWLSQP